MRKAKNYGENNFVKISENLMQASLERNISWSNPWSSIDCVFAGTHFRPRALWDFSLINIERNSLLSFRANPAHQYVWRKVCW